MAVRSVSRVVVVMIGALVISAAASAQEHPLVDVTEWLAPDANAVVAWSLDDAPVARGVVRASRPRVLVPLYVSVSTLQVLDIVTTYRGLNAGAYETNSLVRNGNVGTTMAIKAATTGLGIVLAEKLWKKNKAAAVMAMVASSVVGATVVSNNLRVIKTMTRR